mmetsp:Transcript_173840/g.422799  ORF Transcript_173840/g.422799 Transcript_173840/m.422799 type:complete len:159 (+) Transcript_173840:635-1111(+)
MMQQAFAGGGAQSSSSRASSMSRRSGLLTQSQSMLRGSTASWAWATATSTTASTARGGVAQHDFSATFECMHLPAAIVHHKHATALARLSEIARPTEQICIGGQTLAYRIQLIAIVSLIDRSAFYMPLNRRADCVSASQPVTTQHDFLLQPRAAFLLS